MTKSEIQKHIDLVTKAFSSDEEILTTPEVRAAVMALIGQIVLDINRAANAIEKLSKELEDED